MTFWAFFTSNLANMLRSLVTEVDISVAFILSLTSSLIWHFIAPQIQTVAFPVLHSIYHTGQWGSLCGNCSCRSVEERKFLRKKQEPFWTHSVFLKSALLAVLAPGRLASCGRRSAACTLVPFLTFLISDSSTLISALSHTPALLAHSACLSSWFLSFSVLPLTAATHLWDPLGKFLQSWRLLKIVWGTEQLWTCAF